MSYNITKQNGWYGLESDGNRKYRWSSELSTIHIDGDISKFNFLLMTAGSNVSGKKIEFKYEDGSTFTIFSKNSWCIYIIPLRNSKHILMSSEITIPPGEIRKLGIQVSDMTLSIDDKMVWTINNLKSKWIDIVYVLHTSERSEIKLKFKNTEKKFLVSAGGHRTLSFELNDIDIENNSVAFSILQKKSENVVIDSIVNRADYYDYFGLKSSKHYDDDSKQNEEECQIVAFAMPLSFQWFVNWKCNFQCSYCWQETSKEIYRSAELNKIPWQKWVEMFNRYQPHDIYITGGEPTLYKDLPEFINGLNEDIVITMTTNAGKTFDLEKWKQFVKPNRIWDIFFSLHPTQWRNIDDFYKKVDEYIEFYKSGYCGIEMVGSPKNLELINISDLTQWCNDRKINCRIDPYYVPAKYVPLNNTDNITETILLINTKDNYEGRIPVNVGKQYTPYYCPAGWKKINLDPKGDVFTCMSAVDRNKAFGEHSMPHYNSMGNIFDENFKLRDKPILCWETYRCSQCDSSQLSPAWKPFSNKVDVYLPLAE